MLEHSLYNKLKEKWLASNVPNIRKIENKLHYINFIWYPTVFKSPSTQLELNTAPDAIICSGTRGIRSEEMMKETLSTKHF